MTNASMGFLIGTSIITYIFFYITVNIKIKELQVLFFGIGLSLITVNFHICTLVAREYSLTGIETTMGNLVTISTYITYFIFFLAFLMFFKKVMLLVANTFKKHNIK